jgi:6-phosphofructokinase 2
MKCIATLTMNPAVDIAYDTDRLVPDHKLRTDPEQYDPGGGGINVARVIAQLGGTARAHYLAGGVMGAALDGLLRRERIDCRRIDIAGNTRVSMAVYERETGRQFRFVPPGPSVSEVEWRLCLDRLREVDCDYLVASGSLPIGVPDDFYERVHEVVQERGIELIVDSSGEPLRCALQRGGLLLVKPSRRELEQVTGCALETVSEIAGAAHEMVAKGQAKLVAVTLGAEGAMLAQHSGVVHMPAMQVAARSTVGAGDSFLGAMTMALAGGRDPAEAFRFGMAAGTAAVLNQGTALARLDDVERILKTIAQPTAIAAAG